MAATKFYLDTRGSRPGKEAPLKLAIAQKGRTALIHLNVRILPSQWDRHAGKITGHPNKLALNHYICGRKQLADAMILKWIEAGELSRMSATEIKGRVMAELSPEETREDNGRRFAARLLRFARGRITLDHSTKTPNNC